MMKQIITIFLGVVALTLLKPSFVLAVDNMCNVNLDCGTDQSKWEKGWGDARQAENSNATPSQPEWTNASQPEPQVIRLATESNDINRASNTTDALNGVANDTPIPTTGSVANNDLRITGLPADVSPQVAALNQQFVYPNGTASSTALTSADFEKQGVTNFIDGKLCDRAANGIVVCKKTDGVYTGRIEVYSCTPDQLVPATTSNSTGGFGTLICTSNYREYSGSSIDCVAEANRTCSVIQIDVAYTSTSYIPAGSGGAAYGGVICYPTSYANCGTTVAPVVAYVPPTGGGSQPPTTQENPPGGPTPTPITTPPPGSSFQCQQVKVFRNNVEITPADIQLGDTIVFRGFASAVNTTVSKLRFTLTKAGIAQTPVDVNTTLVGGQYQADYTVNIDTAASYSVTAVLISP